MSYTITQGNTLPPLKLTLSDGFGNPIDLTYRIPIVTIASETTSEAVVSRAATVTDVDGKAQLDWLPGETDNLLGAYLVKVTVLDDNGDTFSVPVSGFGRIVVGPKLGGGL